MALNADFFDRVSAMATLRLGWRPEHANDFDAWTRSVRDKLTELLKLDRTATGSPEARTVSREDCDGFVREKVVITDELFGDVPAYVLLPESRRPAPGVVCHHGHGGYFAGKVMVAGVTDTHPIAVECAEALNYGYGVQLARAGFATICPDAFNFGERMFEHHDWPERHVCPDYAIALAPYGLTPAGITVHSNVRVVDYLLSRPEVCGESVGCVGLSFGGHQTAVLSCIDTRVAAAVISGCLFTFIGGLPPKETGCPAQMVPGVLEWFDYPDICAAIAPRPLLFEFMKQDCCFDFDRSQRLYERVKSVYAAGGAGDRIDQDVADTDHRYIGDLVPAFFEKHLTAVGEA